MPMKYLLSTSGKHLEKLGIESFLLLRWIFFETCFFSFSCEFRPQNSSGAFPTDVNPGNSSIPYHCYHDGTQVVESFNYKYDNLPRDFIALAILLVAFRFLAYICLYFRANVNFKRQKPTRNNTLLNNNEIRA